MVFVQIMGIEKDHAVWLLGHSNERCAKSYFNSIYTQAIKYNAGFFETPMETYYAPRDRIALQEADGRVWLQRLGPFLGAFTKSVERMGDPFFAESDFMLPQFLMVALQDGMYFVGDERYHDKPWATFLVDLLGPSYKLWAVENYDWAIAEEKRYDGSRFSSNWESILTGDFLCGETMEINDEVTEDVIQKHHSPQLIQESHIISSSIMSPAPPPVLIPATPRHPSTPQQQLVPVLPRPRQMKDYNNMVRPPPLVECHNQYIQRKLAFPVLRIASPYYQHIHPHSSTGQPTSQTNR
jgi:hypothetical protein